MINVYVDKLLAGQIEKSESESDKYIFGYNNDCLPENAVSLTMPKQFEQFEYYGLHPIFDMNIPEGALFERLRKNLSKALPKFDDLTLLGILGKFQIGRLRYTQPGEVLGEVPTLNITDLIVNDGSEGLFDNLMTRFAAYSGVSGAQPKILIKSNESSIDRFSYRGPTHIVKAWMPDDFPELAANEYFCMKAAKYSKLEVPEIELTNNRKFLIVKRFDMFEGKYLGFEDFCVLNGKTSKQKYEGSYESICKRIKNYTTSNFTQSSLESFFKSFVLSCALRNGDAHLKNFGLLYSDTLSGVKLAPAYDIVTTTPYIPDDSLALTLGGSKRWPTNEKLINFAVVNCNINQTKSKEIIDEVAHGIAKAVVELKQFVSINDSFKPMGQKIIQTWELGLIQLLSQF